MFALRSYPSTARLAAAPPRRRPTCLAAAGERALSVSFAPRNEAQDLTKTVVAEEKQDVSSMDQLLRIVREKSDPTYHNLVPMRSPISWSEALINSASTTAPTLSTTAPTPSQQRQQLPAGPLPKRRMHDSYAELMLPFGTSAELFEQYTNASGGIRTGKLMEHLDSLAGSIAYKHMLGPGVETLGRIQETGFYIVTASVDRLDMLSPLNPKRDLRISGQVIYTGRSSMEVAVKMEHVGRGRGDETVLIGRFSMVCRDARTNRSREVCPLEIVTLEERELYALGEHMRVRRQSAALTSLEKVPPSSEEAAALHAFYLQHGEGHDEGEGASASAIGTEGPGCASGAYGERGHGEDHVFMGDTVLEKCMLMFPQERNVHQKVFGGYLMRLAYELGFTNAAMFTRGHVKFLSLDGISFARPVPIGSILRLRSQILHTSVETARYAILVHVGVKADVVDVKTGLEQTTNDFRFTWCQERGLEASPNLRQVVPKTYREAMLWLEGKRALAVGAEIRDKNLRVSPPQP